MKIAISACFSAKGYMDIKASQGAKVYNIN
jgi:hypothetical protein